MRVARKQALSLNHSALQEKMEGSTGVPELPHLPALIPFFSWPRLHFERFLGERFLHVANEPHKRAGCWVRSRSAQHLRLLCFFSDVAGLGNDRGLGCGWRCRLIQQCVSIRKEPSRNTIVGSLCCSWYAIRKASVFQNFPGAVGIILPGRVSKSERPVDHVTRRGAPDEKEAEKKNPAE